MPATGPRQQPTPERFFNALNAYAQTEAMRAAIELEIFTAIAEGNSTSATIARRCGAGARRTDGSECRQTVSSEVCPELAKRSKDHQFTDAAFHRRPVGVPGGRMGYENRVEAGLQRGINVGERAVAHHPAIGFHDLELSDQALKDAGIFLHYVFNGVKIGLQPGPLDLGGLFGGFSLREQD